MPTGPWGSGPPWNPQPPDLEEQIRRVQQALWRWLSGGNFGGDRARGRRSVGTFDEGQQS